MTIYTDTNGRYPRNLSIALRLLELAMESRPLDEIMIERFNEVAKEIDEGMEWLEGI